MSFDSTEVLQRLTHYPTFFADNASGKVIFEAGGPPFWFSGETMALIYGPAGGLESKWSKQKVIGKFPIGVVSDGALRNGLIRFYPNEQARLLNPANPNFLQLVSVKGKLPLNQDHIDSIRVVWSGLNTGIGGGAGGSGLLADALKESSLVELFAPPANLHQKKGHILRGAVWVSYREGF